MSRILCNTISVDFIQKYTFFIANRDWNPLANCKNIPSIDLNLWRDKTNDENDEIRKNNTGKNKKIKNQKMKEIICENRGLTFIRFM